MKRLVALAVLALLVAAPVADARRDRLRGNVKSMRAKAPKRWRVVTGWSVVRPPAATPTPVPTAGPGATPVPQVTPTPTPGSTLPPANQRSVSVRSTEFALTLSQPSVLSGPVRVQFDNSAAEDPHQLAIDGPDPAYWDFGVVDPGVVTQRTITMESGSYVLFCPLPQHEALGMRATLTVR